MALYHENFAWDADYKAMKKLLLVRIARIADRATRDAIFTVQEMAFKCGMSDSAVRTYLRELEVDGHITSLPMRDRRLFYRVNLPAAA